MCACCAQDVFMNFSSDLPLVTAYISLPSISSYNTKDLCLPSVPDTNNQQTSDDFKACGNCLKHF